MVKTLFTVAMLMAINDVTVARGGGSSEIGPEETMADYSVANGENSIKVSSVTAAAEAPMNEYSVIPKDTPTGEIGRCCKGAKAPCVDVAGFEKKGIIKGDASCAKAKGNYVKLEDKKCFHIKATSKQWETLDKKTEKACKKAYGTWAETDDHRARVASTTGYLNQVYSSNNNYWLDFKYKQYTGFGGGSMIRFTTTIHQKIPILSGQIFNTWVQMFPNGSIIPTIGKDNKEAMKASELDWTYNQPPVTPKKDEPVIYEDISCSVKYTPSIAGSTKFRPYYNHYWLKQGCGTQRIAQMTGKGWPKRFNDSNYKASTETLKNDVKCDAFWTNLDNSVFTIYKYQWGGDKDEIDSSISCSAARDFKATLSRIQLKQDRAIKLMVGYNVFQTENENVTAPIAYGWGIPIIILIQKTGAMASVAIGAAITSATVALL